MDIAEVLYSAFSIRRYLFVDGHVSCDGQAAHLIMERLSRQSCTYVTRHVLVAPLLRNIRASFLVCWYHVDKFWRWIKFWPQNMFVSYLQFVSANSNRVSACRREGSLGYACPRGSSHFFISTLREHVVSRRQSVLREYRQVRCSVFML